MNKLAQGCQLSMDGRGAWRDNVFVERPWRGVKSERVYLKACDSVSAARADVAEPAFGGVPPPKVQNGSSSPPWRWMSSTSRTARWNSVSQGPDGSDFITLSSRPQALPVHGQ
jgi:hypothetical protein